MPGCAMCLLNYYVETVRANRVSCGTGMLVDGGRGLEMFFEPVPKGSASLTYIILRKIGKYFHATLHLPIFPLHPYTPIAVPVAPSLVSTQYLFI